MKNQKNKFLFKNLSALLLLIATYLIFKLFNISHSSWNTVILNITAFVLIALTGIILIIPAIQGKKSGAFVSRFLIMTTVQMLLFMVFTLFMITRKESNKTEQLLELLILFSLFLAWQTSSLVSASNRMAK